MPSISKRFSLRESEVLQIVLIFTLTSHAVLFSPPKAESHDPGDYPEVVPFKHHSSSNRSQSKPQSPAFAESDAKWKFLECLEIALKTSIDSIATRNYPEPQKCVVDFEYDAKGVKNIEAAQFSKDPGFDYLAKRAVLGLNNDPSVKLPNVLLHKCFRITAVFCKSKEGSSVNVRSSELLNPSIGTTSSRANLGDEARKVGQQNTEQSNEQNNLSNGSSLARFKPGKVVGHIDRALGRERSSFSVPSYGANWDPYLPNQKEEASMILGICSTYHHCSSKIVDQLHCFQLESLLLDLKRKKAILVQTKKVKTDIRDIDANLCKLKNFGTKRLGALRAKPEK